MANKHQSPMAGKLTNGRGATGIPHTSRSRLQKIPRIQRGDQIPIAGTTRPTRAGGRFRQIEFSHAVHSVAKPGTSSMPASVCPFACRPAERHENKKVNRRIFEKVDAVREQLTAAS
jgi:hypothetical protein